MFTAQVRFHCQCEDHLQAIYTLLAAWYQHGQSLASRDALVRLEGQVLAFLSLPEVTSLALEVSGRSVCEALDGYRNLTGTVPEIEILGEEPEGPPACRCVSPGGFMLYTHWLSIDSPLRCLDCFRPVPLYRVPPTHGDDYLDLLGWAGNYQACDALQMRVTVGERFGEGQMARFDSPLSREGRGLCAALAATTGRPTYYHLHRMRGRKRILETQRTCPGCGGEWALTEALHGLFEFKCDVCRLLSNLPCGD